MTPGADGRGGGETMREMLVALWEKSREGILDRVTVIETAVEALRNGTLDAELRAAGERAAHKLAGVAGTFGFSEATDLSREAEEALEGDAEISPDAVVRLSEIAVALRTQLSAAPEPPSR